VDEDITEHMTCSDEGDAIAWLAKMIGTLKREYQVRVFVTPWAIYMARSTEGDSRENFLEPLSVHSFLEAFISDLQLSEEIGKKRQVSGVSPPTIGWLLPHTDMVKINVDAATRKTLCG
jgi:hypothetical protein